MQDGGAATVREAETGWGARDPITVETSDSRRKYGGNIRRRGVYETNSDNMPQIASASHRIP